MTKTFIYTQLALIIIISSLIVVIKSMFFGISVMIGGLSWIIPNALFLSVLLQKQSSVVGKKLSLNYFFIIPRIWFFFLMPVIERMEQKIIAAKN